MKIVKLRSILMIIWSTFLFVPWNILAAEDKAYPFNTRILKESVQLAIENLELRSNIENKSMLNYHQEILASIHLSTAVITDNQTMEPDFYGIATFFIAKHFGKLALAKKILVEERRFSTNILFKSWIEGELLKIEKTKYKNLISHSIIPLNFTSKSLQTDSFETLERLTQKANSVLYTEKIVHDEFKWILQASEILRDESEQLASDGDLQGSVLKIDLVASLLTSHPISTANKIGPRIIAARTISDLGQLFQALVRYKQLLIDSKKEGNNTWRAIIYEDIGDLYIQMNLLLKAKEAYTNALSISNSINNSRLRLKKKLASLRD